MTQFSRVFRIFVSSSFNDLKVERNALQSRVYPRLRQLAASHGYGFQVIDLRWGVSEEASLDQQAMSICLDEVARCQQTSPRPNFIVLLGDRYGWFPPPPRIPIADFNRLLPEISNPHDKELLSNWYSLDENAVPSEWRLNPRKKGSDFEKYANWSPIETRLQKILAEAANASTFTDNDRLPYVASATEQEIAAGALRVKDAPEHVLCFFRSIDGLPDQFSASEFQAYLKARINHEYPKGVDAARNQLAQIVLRLDPKVPAVEIARSIHDLLKKTSKATLEEEFLLYTLQVLSDFNAKDFVNLDEDNWKIDQHSHNKQNDLKDRLKKYVPKNTYTYRAAWKGDGITYDHIDQLCNDVYRSLEEIILAEIKHPHKLDQTNLPPVRIHSEPELDEERITHQKVANELINFFVGRTSLLSAITQYLLNGNQNLMAVVGAGGSGKSALIAKAVLNAIEKFPDAEIVYRFIGSTPNSSDGRSLLESLCGEISRRYEKSDQDIPMGYYELVPDFEKRIRFASAKKPLIIFLDSLDQLLNNYDAKNLNWLPNPLPPNVHIITSTRPEDETFLILKNKQTHIEVLEGLSLAEGDTLLKQWLKSVNRTLQPHQRKELLDKFVQSNGNPLYLKLAFEEARRWTSYQPHEKLTTGVEEIIQKNLFRRLMSEGNHGEIMVSHAVGYLAASRDGLSEEELVDLLSRDYQVYEWFFRKTYHVPPDLLQLAVEYRQIKQVGEKKNLGWQSQNEERLAYAWLKQDRNPPEQVVHFLKEVLPKENGPRLPIVLWSRLSFDLAPYLTERLVDGTVLMTFYHRELADSAKKAFLSNGQEIPYHRKLANYFRFKSDPGEKQKWNGQYKHGLDELPYQLAKAMEGEQLYRVLTDPVFLEQKAKEVGIEQSIDQDGNLKKIHSGVLKIQEDISLAMDLFPDHVEDRAHIDHRQAITVNAVDQGNGPLVICPECGTAFPITKEMLGQHISCNNPNCLMPLKLNQFVIRSSQEQKAKKQPEKKGWGFWKK